MVKTGEHLTDGGGVGQHKNSTLDLGEIASGHNSWGLVVDSAFESSGAPIDELDGTFGLDGGNGGVDVLGDDVSTVHKAHSHVFAVARVAAGHHGGGLEDRVGDLGNSELLVVGLLGRDDRSVAAEHEMDARVRHKIGLELSNINVKGTIETERSSKRRDALTNKTIEIGEGRALNIETALGNVVKGFIVKHECNIGMLKE
jgi:hypothetical protein